MLLSPFIYGSTCVLLAIDQWLCNSRHRIRWVLSGWVALLVLIGYVIAYCCSGLDELRIGTLFLPLNRWAAFVTTICLLTGPFIALAAKFHLPRRWKTIGVVVLPLFTAIPMLLMLEKMSISVYHATDNIFALNNVRAVGTDLLFGAGIEILFSMGTIILVASLPLLFLIHLARRFQNSPRQTFAIITAWLLALAATLSLACYTADEMSLILLIQIFIAGPFALLFAKINPKGRRLVATLFIIMPLSTILGGIICMLCI